MTVPPPSVPLRLGGREYAAGRLLVLAIVTGPAGAVLDAVPRAVAGGADLVEVDPALVAAVRAAYPEVGIGVRTWRSEVAAAACAAGAVLVHDSAPGDDPELAGVAAAHAAGLVCSPLSAGRATDAGVPAASVLIDADDPVDALLSLGHPVLMSPPRDDTPEGALAATAIAAWLGVKVFRTSDVPATRRTLDMVASIRGDRPPARPVRGLA